MNELVSLIAEKTGVSEEIAEQAVGVVIGFLKDKLPEPIAGQVEGVLAGKAASGLRGLFG